MNIEEKQISITIGNNDDRNLIKYFYNPSLNIWGERLIHYMNYIIQDNSRRGTFKFSGKFNIKELLEVLDISVHSRRLVAEATEKLRKQDIDLHKAEYDNGIKVNVFDRLEVKRGVVYYTFSKPFIDSSWSSMIQNDNYSIITTKEFLKYKLPLSFKLTRYLKSRVSLGKDNLRLEVDLNDIRRILYGDKKTDWKFYPNKRSSERDVLIKNSSFLSKMVKPALKEINLYSNLEIKGPVNQDLDEDDERSKTITLIVSHSKTKNITDSDYITATGFYNELVKHVDKNLYGDKKTLSLEDKNKNKSKAPMKEIPIF